MSESKSVSSSVTTGKHHPSTSSTKKSSRISQRFSAAKKLDSAVDFVKSATADQKLPNGPTPPLRMGAPPSVSGFSETFITSVFSQAIVKIDADPSEDNNNNTAGAAATADPATTKKKKK